MTPQWSDDLATGVSEIDMQHRELLAKVAALDDAAASGDLTRAVDVLAYLERYALYHFAAEERHMVSSGYPGFREHRDAHEAFVAELLERKEKYEATRSAVSLLLDLSDWLAGWLQDHVRGADAEMARHLRAAGR